jgi:hypothetical protein
MNSQALVSAKKRSERRHADEDAPINNWRAPRESLENYATFTGFER